MSDSQQVEDTEMDTTVEVQPVEFEMADVQTTAQEDADALMEADDLIDAEDDMPPSVVSEAKIEFSPVSSAPGSTPMGSVSSFPPASFTPSSHTILMDSSIAVSPSIPELVEPLPNVAQVSPAANFTQSPIAAILAAPESAASSNTHTDEVQNDEVQNLATENESATPQPASTAQPASESVKSTPTAALPDQLIESVEEQLEEESSAPDEDLETATLAEDEFHMDFFQTNEFVERPPAQKELLDHIQFPPSLSKYLVATSEEEDELAEETVREVDSEDVTRRAPPILFTFRNESFWLFAAFKEYEGESPTSTPLFDDPAEHHLYYNSLDMLFKRLHDHFPSFEESQMEMIFSVDKLDMTISEDNAYSSEVSLHDFGRIHTGCDQPTPMQLSMSESPRFIHRFNALAKHVAKFTADDMQNLSDDGKEATNEDDTLQQPRDSQDEEAELVNAENEQITELLDDLEDGGEAFAIPDKVELVEDEETLEEDQLESSPRIVLEDEEVPHENVEAVEDAQQPEQEHLAPTSQRSEIEVPSHGRVPEEFEDNVTGNVPDEASYRTIEAGADVASTPAASETADSSVPSESSASSVISKADSGHTLSPKRAREESILTPSDLPNVKQDLIPPEAKRVRAQ